MADEQESLAGKNIRRRPAVRATIKKPGNLAKAALQVISNAAAIRPSTSLRTEAVASLALTDLVRAGDLAPLPRAADQAEMDAALEHFAYGDDKGNVFVCRRRDGFTTMKLDALDAGPGMRQAVRSCSLTCVSTGSAALKAIPETKPDLVILDNILDDGEKGLEFLPKLKTLAAHVPVIMISGTLQIREKLAALQGPRSAHYILEKPVDLDELDQTVEIALTECGFGETVDALQSLERAEKIEASEPDRRFTERLARQHELIKRLRGSSERPNISALSREFNVSRKTIIRDLQDLIRRGQLPEEIYPEWQQEPADE